MTTNTYSHLDIYSARARLEDGRVLFEIAEDSKSGFRVFRPSKDANDVDGLVRVLEGIALSYCWDGISVYSEQGKRYEAPEAYALWAKRVEEGTGIVLPKARLSRLYQNCGVPPDITGSKWGDLIDIYQFNFRGPKKMMKTPDDLSAVCANTEEGERFLFGDRKHGHELSDRNEIPESIPTLFTPENAGRMLERLQTLMPEHTWRLVSASEIKASFLGELLAA
jgi:hypothetical protein